MSLRSHLGVLKKLGNSTAKQASENLQNAEAVELRESYLANYKRTKYFNTVTKIIKKRKLFDLSYRF